MGDSQSGRAWTDDPETFADSLEDLKEDGCMLLVLGAADDDGDRVGCDRMLGDAARDRRRLFVRSDAATTPSAGEGTSDADSQTVVYETSARAVAAASAAVSEDDRTVSGGMDSLADATEEEISALEPAGGFESGQLRVCVDGVDDLLADTDLASVGGFVRRVREAVSDADAIGHVHVDDTIPGHAVEGVLQEFDAVVEVADAGERRQRWHLPDEALSTAWLEL
ncbi:MAG: hypothetical protein ABEJ88_09765 [Halobacterium sp.]